jgi:hypothetical protein
LAPPLHKLRARRRGNSAERPDMIDWINLSSNKNPGRWTYSCGSQNVDYSVVFKNPAVFVLDLRAETPHRALQRRTGGGVAPRGSGGFWTRA